MKGRKLNLLFEIAICCLPALLFYGCFYLGLGQAAKDEYKISQKPDSVRFDLQNLWNMELPNGISPVYVFYNRYGWMGEGEFFAAYSCTDCDNGFTANYSDKYNEEVQNRTDGYFERFPYDSDKYEIILDKQYRPDWTKDYMSVSYHKGVGDKIYTGKDECEEYCDDHLYFSYFPEIQILYIYELLT